MKNTTTFLEEVQKCQYEDNTIKVFYSNIMKKVNERIRINHMSGQVWNATVLQSDVVTALISSWLLYAILVKILKLIDLY